MLHLQLAGHHRTGYCKWAGKSGWHAGGNAGGWPFWLLLGWSTCHQGCVSCSKLHHGNLGWMGKHQLFHSCARWYAFESSVFCMVTYVSLELRVFCLCILPAQGREAFIQHGLQLRCAISIVLSSLVSAKFYVTLVILVFSVWFPSPWIDLLSKDNSCAYPPKAWQSIF